MMVQLMPNRMVWAALSACIGFLQAWDSNGLEAGAFARTLIAAGVLLPSTAIAASAHRGLALGALIAGAVLLTWARIISPVSLNALHIGLFVPALYVFLVSRIDAASARKGPA
jgi:hypothetical protein